MYCDRSAEDYSAFGPHRVVHVSTTKTPCHKNIRLQQTMVFFPITNAGWAYRNPRSDRPVYRRVIVVAPIGGCGSEVFASLISCEHWEVKTYIQRTAAVKLLTMDMTSVDVQGSPHVKLHRVCICIAAHIHKRCFEHGKHPDRSLGGISHCCASVHGCFGGGNPCGGFFGSAYTKREGAYFACGAARKIPGDQERKGCFVFVWRVIT